MLADHSSVLHQLFLDQPNRFQRGSATDRIAAKRGCMRAWRPAHEVGPRHNRSQRQTGRDPFRKGDDVRLDAKMLNGEHFSSPPHARLHLISNQKDAVLPGQPFQLLKELRGRHDVSAFSLDGLEHDGGNLIGAEDGFEQLILNHPKAGWMTAAISRPVGTAVTVWIRNMRHAFQERPESSALHGLAGSQ